MRAPTTTHFAVLGLLAVQPWTTYELIRYMRGSNVRSFWTKTEGRLYETPVELVDMGYATATRERISNDPKALGRERTLYAITEPGRSALREWLSQPSQPPRLEIEGLLKLAYGEQGTVEDFIAQIVGLQAQLVATANVAGLRRASANPQLPSRHHLSARMADLTDRVKWAVWEWLNELEQEVRGWDDMLESPERLAEAQQLYGEIDKRVRQRIEPLR